MRQAAPARGEIWYVNLDPVRGHEQTGKRPALVISETTFNRGPAKVVAVLPITSKPRGIISHVEIKPPEGSLKLTSFVMCEQVRTISQERLSKRVGVISSAKLKEIEGILAMLLGIAVS